MDRQYTALGSHTRSYVIPYMHCWADLTSSSRLLVKGTAREKIVPDKTLSDGGGAPEHQSLKPRTAELCAIPVWWESMHKWEKWTLFTSVPPKFSRGKQATSRVSSHLVTVRTNLECEINSSVQAERRSQYFPKNPCNVRGNKRSLSWTPTKRV